MKSTRRSSLGHFQVVNVARLANAVPPPRKSETQKSLGASELLKSTLQIHSFRTSKRQLTDQQTHKSTCRLRPEHENHRVFPKATIDSTGAFAVDVAPSPEGAANWPTGCKMNRHFAARPFAPTRRWQAHSRTTRCKTVPLCSTKARFIGRCKAGLVPRGHVCFRNSLTPIRQLPAWRWPIIIQLPGVVAAPAPSPYLRIRRSR